MKPVLLQDLCRQDSDAEMAFAKPGCNSTLMLEKFFWTAYETRGGDIKVSTHDGASWSAPQNITASYPRRTQEMWTQPQLVHGTDDLVWLFYISHQRRLLFCHRYLGEAWSSRTDLPGIYHVLPFYDGSFGEDRAPLHLYQARAENNRIIISLQSPSQFWDPPPDHLQVPDEFVAPHGAAGGGPGQMENYPLKKSYALTAAAPEVRRNDGILFLDNHEVAAVQGLRWFAGHAAKETSEPVLQAGENIWEGMALNLSGGSAMYHDGAFHLWYTGFEFPGEGELPKFAKLGENWMKYGKVCYARSLDGINWERPNLQLTEYLGRKDNNIVPNLWRGPLFFVDDAEPDAQKRFKTVQLFEIDNFCSNLIKFGTSADGLHWHFQPGKRHYPGARPWFYGWESFFRDDAEPDPKRRWKLYGYCGTGPRRRACVAAFSADCINWEIHTETPVITPRQVRGDCIHDLIVWKEAGIYIGLLQVGDKWHDYHLELVSSRDGVNFSMVQDGQPFLARGGAGAWDCGSLCGCTPFSKDGKMYLYYSASNLVHDESTSSLDMWVQKDRFRTHIGVATITAGRYAGFTPDRHESCGRLITVPITPQQDEDLCLTLNADIATDERIRVACLDADNQMPLPGLALDDCQPLRENAVMLPVRWQERGHRLPDRPFRLQIELCGAKSALYGLNWQHPDEIGDGQLTGS